MGRDSSSYKLGEVHLLEIALQHPALAGSEAAANSIAYCVQPHMEAAIYSAVYGLRRYVEPPESKLHRLMQATRAGEMFDVTCLCCGKRNRVKFSISLMANRLTCGACKSLLLPALRPSSFFHESTREIDISSMYCRSCGASSDGHIEGSFHCKSNRASRLIFDWQIRALYIGKSNIDREHEASEDSRVDLRATKTRHDPDDFIN